VSSSSATIVPVAPNSRARASLWASLLKPVTRFVCAGFVRGYHGAEAALAAREDDHGVAHLGICDMGGPLDAGCDRLIERGDRREMVSTLCKTVRRSRYMYSA